MHRVPHKSRKQANKILPERRCGQVVSVDQMDGTAGFIAQLKRKLTTQRFQCATIVVDHHSRTSYIYPQMTTGSKHTLRSKRTFEAFVRKNNVPQIHHYQCDNDLFHDNAFIDDCTEHGQTILFCGVSAHHQNGIAEKNIRDVIEQARKMLLHVSSK